MRIDMLNMKSSYTLILCKMSGKEVGMIPNAIVENIKRGIKTVSELTFSVSKYCGAENTLNPLYNELKTERFIKLNTTECYVIKNIKEINENTKQVTAYSREKKLFKIKAEFEDLSIALGNVKDIDGCYNLNDLLYEDTGWKLGYISDSVKYKSKETVLDNLTGAVDIELINELKVRYQESVSTNWYDYINTDIAEQFECYPVFDSYNKKIKLYSDEEFGEETPILMLSYDNYLKSLESESDTEDIITKLNLIGNEDLTISEINPSGETFIEDFSYFMNSGEMSAELTQALITYNKVVKNIASRWDSERQKKLKNETELTSKKNELLVIYSNIKSTQFTIEQSSDDEYKALQMQELVRLNNEKVILENRITKLNEDINNSNTIIDNLNKLCKKKYAVDDNGILIFNDDLLNELKEFIYQDTYSNDSITDALTLMRVGKRQLKQQCQPTKTWSIDLVNFIERLIDNDFRQHWSGKLGLGDVIVLKGEKTIEHIYLIGYTQNLKEKTMQLELSNKKSENDFSLSIGERLTKGMEAYNSMVKNRSTINKVNKNRVGLKYDKVNKKVL